MNKLSAALTLALFASCSFGGGGGGVPDPESKPALAADSRGAPGPERYSKPAVLSDRAVWAVEGATTDLTRCFGAAVAVGDLDGDGYRDVIVAEGQCSSLPVLPGRIAIYRGGPGLPSVVPMWTELDWQNSPNGSRRMALAVGDVDGDRRDDLVVSSTSGVQVFAGIKDLRAPLGAPTFRVPGTPLFGKPVLADVNGDHRDDLISVRLGTATVWLSTPGAAAPFTATRTFPASFAVAVGDTNHDGKDDVVLTDVVDSQLWLGCRARERGCDGGLSATPAWATSAQPVLGMIPDLNHDGLSEALVADTGFDGLAGFGRVWLYLSERSTGGLAALPAWSTLGDPGYPGLGNQVVIPGDLDGDHRSTEFLISSAGRIYAFFPGLDQLADLRPGFAWPRSDEVRDQIATGEVVLGTSSVVAAAGDVDGDHIDDLIVGDPLDFGQPRPGRVLLFAGGRRPVRPAPPFLPGAPVCELPAGGKPDITVDAPALARSLFVDTVEFAPDACEIAEGCVAAPGVRRLLRFATSVANFGGSPATIPGPDRAPELYRFDGCEGEPELEDFARFDLIDATGATLSIGRKQAIFLVDIAPNCINAGPATDFGLDMGISPGWGDVYVADTPCQWLDATDVPDGRYTLRVSVDTKHLIDQDDVRPDTASIHLELRGTAVTVLP